MIIRILVFIGLISLSATSYAYSTIFTSEPVPGANCKCVSNDNCVNLQTRKYECTVLWDDSANSSSVNLGNMNPLGNRSIQSNTASSRISDPNRDIANFLSFIIFGWIFIYFLPIVIVLLSKNRAHRISTILINVLLGWSVIGWFVALFLSLQSNLVRVEILQKIDNSEKIV